MSRVIESYSVANNKRWSFILKDLYSEEEEDYLLAPNYYYDFLIENPPWGESVFPFLVKAYASMKPFAFLLSIEVLSFKKINALLREKGAMVYLISPKPRFLRNGRDLQVGGCIWVIGNYKEVKEIFIKGTIVLKKKKRSCVMKSRGSTSEQL